MVMRYALLVLLMAACGDPRRGSDDQPLWEPMTLDECSTPELREAIACGFDPPGSGDDFATCYDLAYMCDGNTFVSFGCLQERGLEDLNIPDACAPLADVLSLRDQWVSTCGQRVERDEWAPDPVALRAAVDACAPHESS